MDRSPAAKGSRAFLEHQGRGAVSSPHCALLAWRFSIRSIRLACLDGRPLILGGPPSDRNFQPTHNSSAQDADLKWNELRFSGRPSLRSYFEIAAPGSQHGRVRSAWSRPLAWNPVPGADAETGQGRRMQSRKRGYGSQARRWGHPERSLCDL